MLQVIKTLRFCDGMRINCEHCDEINLFIQEVINIGLIYMNTVHGY